MSNSTVHRILVADDQQSILDEFRNILEGKSEDRILNELESKLFGESKKDHAPKYDIVTVTQGHEAVEAVRGANNEERPFAVAFLDMRMPPGLDGLVTAENIRQIDPDIHFVFVTAFSDVDSEEIARRVQPIDKLLYVQKPFYPQEIKQIAAAFTAKWELQLQLEHRNKQLARVIQKTLAQNKQLRSRIEDLSPAEQI